MVSLSATPTSALVDEDVTITMSGLHPYQHVTMVAILHEEKIKMFSYAFYVADGEGRVDVTTMPSVGGFYTGVEPMGFIWSMKLTPDQERGSRLMKRNVFTPVIVHIRLYSGHIDVLDPEHISTECLATSRLERWYMSPEVERVEVRRGRIQATLFLPKAAGVYPGVLDLFGTIGGLVEYRASLLASRGFVAMALAYFWPGVAMTGDLEYFEEAINLLAAHPKVLATGIGIVGVSKGAELSNLISVVCPKVRAVVAINGPSMPWGQNKTYGDVTFTAQEAAGLELSYTDEGINVDFSSIEREREQLRQYVIPIEKSSARHLLIHSTDDGGCPCTIGQLLVDRMVNLGQPDHKCRVVMYPGAGHLIEPPYSPLFRVAYNKLFNGVYLWGGRPKAHAEAQYDLWHRLQSFLKTTLAQSKCQL